MVVRGPDRGGQLVRVEVPVGRVQAHQPRHGAGHSSAGRIGVVGRLEHDDLVAGLAQRQERGGNGLGGPDGHEDVGVGVEVEAVPVPLVGGDGLAQLGDALAGRVLVAAVADGVDGHLFEFLGPVGIGEALAEIDRVRSRGRAPTWWRRSWW